MLSRQASHALKALLELAAEPGCWRSTQQLATAQQLPQPMLEQLLLRLRRAGVLEARRGRKGGFRLARPAAAISLAAVLSGLGETSGLSAAEAGANSDISAADMVTSALERRLERARQQALAALSLEDLLFDLRSAEASTDSETGLLLG
ncbi:MAG: Rrf2 family transcriptional regulator [Chitinophagaceae bacterium]|jgi:Rrf2 family protein|nr:Rrf2 family transcriptional regulator [Chitinophagaceae bacterium]